MILVGLQFEPLRPAQEDNLVRFIFQKMREEARERRHLVGEGGLAQTEEKEPGAELRQAVRIKIWDHSVFAIIMAIKTDHNLSFAEVDKVLEEAVAPENIKSRSVEIVDISAGGCLLRFPGEFSLQKGDKLYLKVSGPDIQLMVWSKIVMLKIPE